MAWDLGAYHRVSCCITAAAEAVLDDNGLPVPGRRDIAEWGKQGDPGCCDALLVKTGRGSRVPAPNTSGCGPVKRQVEYEIRLFRDVCLDPPDCGELSTSCIDSGVYDRLKCDVDVWPFDSGSVGCGDGDVGVQTALMHADRQVMERRLAHEVFLCLCETVGDCPECADSCESVEWVATEPVTGGGCAGWLFRLRVVFTA